MTFQKLRLAAFVGLNLPLVALPASAWAQTTFNQPGHGVSIPSIDHSVKPADDFYQFANGGWLTQTPLPADKPAFGAFNEVDERNQAIVREIVEAASSDKAASAKTSRGKVGMFYRVGMDEARAERLGIKPLAPTLARINAIQDKKGLIAEIARLHREGVSAAFGVGVGQDAKDSTQVIAEVGQGGTGLPTRDYYVNQDEKSKAIRAQYVAHIARVFVLSGEKPDVAKLHAEGVLAFETRLAKASLAPVQLRDPSATYHKMSVAGLQSLAPQADWSLYLRTLGKPNPGDINVGMPDFMREVGKMVADTPLDQWKTYLRWFVLVNYSNTLNKAFVDENFAFASAITGQKVQTPRWKRILGATDGVLGDAIGQLYVERTFSPEAKARALALVKNLQAALREQIQGLDWMEPATKTQALRKLDAMRIKIGYPDKWRDYSALTVADDSYAQNLMRASDFTFNRELAKIGKPVERTEWGLTPPTVNAYYNPQLNEIVFPAGILQPPFFDAKADDASNYGGIGMVIGHEMTHGFDDQGRQFDADGNLKDWWTAKDAARFKERSGALVTQYSAYTAVADPTSPVKVNGELTQGENIADLGGLKIAYLAFQKTAEGKAGASANPPLIEGYTPDQRFFLAYGQIWRWKIAPQMARLLAGADVHSPNQWRVYGPLVNFPPFVAAFGKPADATVVKPGSGTVSIW